MSAIDAIGYFVTRAKDICVDCTGASVCQSKDCSFLCHHMYNCTCYDFLNGHVCKHIHRVHSLHLTSHTIQLESTVNEESSRAHDQDQTTAELLESTTDLESPSNHNQTAAHDLPEGTAEKESSPDKAQAAPGLINQLADINLEDDVPAVTTASQENYFSTGLVYTLGSNPGL